MLIDLISKELARSEEFGTVEGKLLSGKDSALAVAQSARPLMIAALFNRYPRPFLVLVPGEEAADRVYHALAAYLGLEKVYRYPTRTDMPWSKDGLDAQGSKAVAERCQCVHQLARGNACVVVASSRALLQCVPADHAYFEPLTFELGEEHEPIQVAHELIARGYEQIDGASVPGSFYVHGDSIDIFAAQESCPYRLEFFGDEIDRIRKVLPLTGQTIGDVDTIIVYPCRELALTPDRAKRATRLLYQASQDDRDLAHDVERLQNHQLFAGVDQYLPLLHEQITNLIAHASEHTLVVLSEPRALYDDAVRLYEDLQHKAEVHAFHAPLAQANAGSSGELAKAIKRAAQNPLEGLYVAPQALNFGSQQRLTLVSIMRVGTQVDAELAISRPAIEGGEGKLFTQLRTLLNTGFKPVFAVPDRSARESLELRLTDEHIPFMRLIRDEPREEHIDRLPKNLVTLVDDPIASGVIVPSAQLGILSIADMAHRSAKRAKKKIIDPTQITFPFKPGDYVVHAQYGIAHFTDIVRMKVDEDTERDYFLLEYAAQDKLYVPLELVDRLTRYVGPDGSNPRLTRLNSADWTRATNKAKKAVKHLAFDLVDLYTRRASVMGYRYPEDTSWQREMEADFPYQETPDQLSAIADIKADMQSSRPMDRLLCGDVGFGKTEVALRAAFKAIQADKQVMFLCPTTILAQQHFTNAFERFAPYDVRVEVLSRFRTPAQQKQALADFAEGKVHMLVGTHRLLSNDVNPANLGLVIIDEEHRFGVQAKEQLKNMREQVDVLTLSATPIPRTMQMALSGVRDMSLIKTPPAERMPVEVKVGEWDEDVVSAAIRFELARDGQVYYVSNRVRTLDDAAERVQKAAPEARIGIAHGQLSEKELEAVMERFAAGELDVLIATTIIESGIDNPHTNTLIIEDSQRLGLAQLYQLKGRVGRSKNQAYAYFMFPAEERLTPEAFERLTAINEFQELGDGMKVAMRDLEIRGAGSLMGAEQHGNLSAVGFDLFTQMLGEAVAQARGEAGDLALDEVTINVSVDYFISEEYIPEADKRVLLYRKIAGAVALSQIDELEHELLQTVGALPDAAQNLLDRARLRIRASRLGVTSVALVSGKLIFQGIEIPDSLKSSLRAKHAIYYPKSKKLSLPLKEPKDEVLAVAIGFLSLLGSGDDDE